MHFLDRVAAEVAESQYTKAMSTALSTELESLLEIFPNID